MRTYVIGIAGTSGSGKPAQAYIHIADLSEYLL